MKTQKAVFTSEPVTNTFKAAIALKHKQAFNQYKAKKLGKAQNVSILLQTQAG